MTNVNDKKIAAYRGKKIKKWIFISLYVIVIILELLAIFKVIDMIWGCILFIITYLFEKIILK